MIYSTKTEYALRAMRWFRPPQNGSSFVRARMIAHKEKISATFLVKILKKLAEARILVSSRGRGGGYALARAPKKITLEEILIALEGPDKLNQCVVGWASCSDEKACSLHERFKPIRNKVCQYLKSTTVENLMEVGKMKKPILP